MSSAQKQNDLSRRLTEFAIGVCLFVGVFLFTCVNFGSGPNNRTYYYIDHKGTYYSPPLMDRDPRQFAFSMFTQDAVQDGFEPLDDRIKSQTNYEALVYANPKTKKWVVRDDTRDYIPVSRITREEFKDHPNRNPDTNHRDADGFEDWCGPIGWVLRKLGLSKPRFTDDGGWNW